MSNLDLEVAAEIIKAMAHPVRLGVIQLLAKGDCTVTELFQALGCSQSLMSRQLQRLREAKLIRMTRDGQSKRCSLANRDFLNLFSCLEQHISALIQKK